LTMLDKVGVAGYPALLGTRGSVEASPDLPTLTSFNHMIVAVPISPELRPAVERFSAYDAQDQILWIDPTSESDPLGELPEMDQGVYALISYPDRGEIRRTPESPVESNGTEYQAQLRLEATGKGTATVRVKYVGDANARRHSYYRNRSQSELRKIFEGRMAGYASQATLLQAGIAGVEDNRQTVVEEFSFSGEFATASSGESWFLQPLFLAGMAGLELGSKPRVHPFDVGAPYHVKGEYRIEVPPPMKIDRLPDAVSVQSEFGTVQIEYSLTGSVLEVHHTLSFTLNRIPPEKFADFREFVNRAARLGRQQVRVVHD